MWGKASWKSVEIWSIRYMIQFFHVYELNIINAMTDLMFELKDQLCQHSQATFDQHRNHQRLESRVVLAVQWSVK